MDIFIHWYDSIHYNIRRNWSQFNQLSYSHGFYIDLNKLYLKLFFQVTSQYLKINLSINVSGQTYVIIYCYSRVIKLLLIIHKFHSILNMPTWHEVILATQEGQPHHQRKFIPTPKLNDWFQYTTLEIKHVIGYCYQCGIAIVLS